MKQILTEFQMRTSNLGNHRIGIKNEKGELFTGLCQNYNLIIGSTRVSPNHTVENQIENKRGHFGISRAWRKSVVDATDLHLLEDNFQP